MSYPQLIEDLITQFTKLPGIGRRSAERIAFWFLDNHIEDAHEFASSIIKLKSGLMFCRKCNHLTDQETCSICLDQNRDHSTICVVEDPKDVMAIEKSGSFKGLYHVLLGTISPSEGRGPEDIKVYQLIERVKSENIKEVVIATDPDSDGEMTSLYLTKQLKPLGVMVSRIGLGIPVGSSLEFADISTLSMSLTSRREII